MRLLVALPVLAGTPGPVSGARWAVIGALVLMICVLAVRLGRPMLRHRHARLIGATPEQALLQAGLGQPPPGSHETDEPAVAITVLPSKVLPSKRDGDPLELVLGEQDLALAGELGEDHPMSAPGRHRTVAGWLTTGESPVVPDAEALLVPPVVVEALAQPEEPHELNELNEPNEPVKLEPPAEDSAAGPQESGQSEPPDAAERGAGQVTSAVSLTMSWGHVTESDDMSGAAGSSRASEFYGVNWQDEEWQGIDLTGRSGTSGAGDDGTDEWWASAQQPVSAGGSADARAESDVDPEDESTASWWESIAAASLPIPLAAEFAEPEEDVEPTTEPADSGVPAPRESGHLTVAQRDALRTAHGRIRAAEDRIAIARTVTEEAWVLVGADSVAFVAPTPDGPDTLALHPASDQTWGPQTLAALVSVSGPLRAVLDGDPLADGGATAVLAVPVASAGVRVGALVARRVTPRSFAAVDESLLDRLARMAGEALDGMTRRGLLRREQGTADPVTDMPAQGRLAHDLQAALRSQRDHGMPLSLLVAEVEGLARMRTEVGSEQADEVLATVASTVNQGLRVGDLPYRFGDEVLAVLLAGTGLDEATAVALRLTTAVDDTIGENMTQAYELAQPLRLRAVVLPVTGTVQQVMDDVDRALSAQRVRARWA